MSETRIYVPDDMRLRLEKLQVRFGDEKLNQTARRIIRAGLKVIEAEEGRRV
jgi:hypothetical protein